MSRLDIRSDNVLQSKIEYFLLGVGLFSNPSCWIQVIQGSVLASESNTQGVAILECLSEEANQEMLCKRSEIKLGLVQAN